MSVKDLEVSGNNFEVSIKDLDVPIKDLYALTKDSDMSIKDFDVLSKIRIILSLGIWNSIFKNKEMYEIYECMNEMYEVYGLMFCGVITLMFCYVACLEDTDIRGPVTAFIRLEWRRALHV